MGYMPYCYTFQSISKHFLIKSCKFWWVNHSCRSNSYWVTPPPILFLDFSPDLHWTQGWPNFRGIPLIRGKFHSLLQRGIAWLTFYRSDIRVVVRLRCRLCTMISRDPYSKSNICRYHYCKICPAGVTLPWRDEFCVGILKLTYPNHLVI